MSINLWVGSADPAGIVDLVRDRTVDVLTVQEFTDDALRGLAAAGLGDLLPYGELHPAEFARGSGVYSRYPLHDGTVSTNPGGFLQASAVVAVAGAAAAKIVSVHPLPPAQAAWVPMWAEDLRAEPTADSGPPVRVLAGDFNATVDHAQLRSLIATGYVDAAATVGQGFAPTWPRWRPCRHHTKITIDHILVGAGIDVRDLSANAVAMTDHRAVVATLLLARV